MVDVNAYPLLLPGRGRHEDDSHVLSRVEFQNCHILSCLLSDEMRFFKVEGGFMVLVDFSSLSIYPRTRAPATTTATIRSSFSVSVCNIFVFVLCPRLWFTDIRRRRKHVSDFAIRINLIGLPWLSRER